MRRDGKKSALRNDQTANRRAVTLEDLHSDVEEVINMRITILPKSSLGWWSVGLVVANILFFVLAQVILGSGPDYNMPLAYALTTIAVGIALAIFITGLISIIKNKERSILVFLAMAIGLYSLIGGTASLFATLFGLSN
jgi:hypothetical protein